MFGGIAHIWRSKEVVLGVMTVDLFAVLLGGATALLPLYAKDILHVGPTGLGALSAAPAIGAVLMGFVQGHRKKEAHAGRTFLLGGGDFRPRQRGVRAVAELLAVAVLMLIVVGASDNVGAVIRQTVVQLHTPDELRGRVSAVNRVFIQLVQRTGSVSRESFRPALTRRGGGRDHRRHHHHSGGRGGDQGVSGAGKTQESRKRDGLITSAPTTAWSGRRRTAARPSALAKALRVHSQHKALGDRRTPPSGKRR